MSELPFGRKYYDEENREGKLYRQFVEESSSVSWELGQNGLREAREDLQNQKKLDLEEKSEATRNQARVIEGKLDGRIVYREENPFAKHIPNINEIPSGREEEVEYSVKSYVLHQENKRADGEIYRVF